MKEGKMDNLAKAKRIETNNKSQEEDMESASDMQAVIQTINQAPVDSPEFKQLEEEARRLNVRNAFLMNELLSNRKDGNETDKDEGKLLNTFEIGKYFNLAPKTIRGLAGKGHIKGIKIPPGCTRGKWRFKKKDVERGLLLSSSVKTKVKVKAPDVW